jgi:hypothetical protein
MAPLRPGTREIVTTWLDAALLVAAAAALVILLGGRTRLAVAGLRISLRSAANPLAVAAAAAVLRVAIGGWMRLLPAIPAAPRAAIGAERERLARGWPRPRGWAAYVAAAALSSLVWVMPHVLHPRRVPDGGDPVFSAWRLAHIAHQLAHDPRHLFDANIFYPATNTFAYSDATLLQGFIGAPFILAGADPLLVSNAILLAGFPLVALAFFALGWRLTGDPRAALLTAILGAMATLRFEQYSHVEMMLTPFIPLSIVALVDLVLRPSRRRGALLGLLVVGQWLSGMYLGLMLLLWLVPLGGILVLAWAERPYRRLVEGAAAGALVVVAGFGAVAIPYLSAQKAHGGWGNFTITDFSADGRDYRQPSVRSWLGPKMTAEKGLGERRLFPGFVTPALAGAALTVTPAGVVTAAAVSGALAFDWSLGRRGLTYDDIQKRVPAFTGMRVPARFSVFAVTSLIMLAALGAARLLAAADRRGRGAIATAAIGVAAIAIDLRPSFPLMDYWREPPSIYRSVDPSMVLAEFPIGDDPNIAFMYFSTRHRARLLNGYSGFFTPEYIALQERVKTFPAPETIDVVREAGATHLTFNCTLEPRKWRCARTIEMLDDNPGLERVAQDTWQGAPVVLYRFRR